MSATWYKLAGVAALTLVFSTFSHAQVTVAEPWVRATVPQQSGTGAFMNLTAERDTSLVAAESPVAKFVEVHEMAMENNVMKMREIPRLPLPAGEMVPLKPGSYHIMLLELHGQVKEGDTVPLTLKFENADGTKSEVQVQAPVRPLASSGAGHSHGHGDSHGHSHGDGHGDGHGHGAAHKH